MSSALKVAAVTDAEIYAMIDSLGDVTAVLDDRNPAGLSRLGFRWCINRINRP